MLTKILKRSAFLIILAIPVALINLKGTAKVPLAYDLSRPQKKWKLPPALFEVSGNSWIDNNHLMLIEDITPRLYVLRLDNAAVVEKKVLFNNASSKFDVEDVAIAGSTAYALRSHGSIYKIDNWRTKPLATRYQTWLSRKNNTEGLCYDPVSHNLLVACKEESGVQGEKKTSRAVYVFNRQNNKLNKTPFLIIHKSDLDKAGGKKPDIFPSAIAVHPLTHDIYILSSRSNKCLITYSYKGQFRSIQYLDPDIFPQPEGICFAPDGTLYISTEGKKGSDAWLYRFVYR